jgi:2-keto-3-deoxy-L-rhamnonate aldolase RhmA
MRRNIIREKLNAGEKTVGTHIHIAWPAVVEAIGHTGLYDYVEFVAEYGSFDLHDLDNLCRASELHNMGSMIKVDQSHQRFLAQRGIGSGFSCVLFTDCRSADEVRECVRIARADTPEDNGLYGVAARRNAYMGYGGTRDYVQALRDTVVAIMIEKRGAVDELEEILSIPGVDMVQWGGSDFSMNIGRPGEYNHPEVLAAKRKVFETAIKMGVPPRAEIWSPDQAKEYVDMGVRHFSIGTDMAILYGWWKENGEKLKKAIEGA